MSGHVLLILLNKFVKKEINVRLAETRARMLDYIYHVTLRLLLCYKSSILLSICTQRCHGPHNVSRKSVNH